MHSKKLHRAHWKDFDNTLWLSLFSKHNFWQKPNATMWWDSIHNTFALDIYLTVLLLPDKKSDNVTVLLLQAENLYTTTVLSSWQYSSTPCPCWKLNITARSSTTLPVETHNISTALVLSPGHHQGCYSWRIRFNSHNISNIGIHD